MNNIVFALMSIGVGGAIGGLTNALAIKMLFRPRHPWKIGNWKVPFTPGLIPKRREEIAVQFGRIVADHLLTKEGVQETLSSPASQQKLEQWLARYWDQWENSPFTWKETISQLAGKEALERLILTFEKVRDGWIDRIAHCVFAPGDWKGRSIRSFFPNEEEEKVMKLGLIHGISGFVLLELAKFMRSEQGGIWFKSLTKQIGGQGLFGSLAGMLVSETGLSSRIREPVLEFLDSNEAKALVHQLLSDRWDEWINRPIGDLVSMVPEEQMGHWLQEAGKRTLDAGPWLDRNIAPALAAFSEKKESFVGAVSRMILQWGCQQIHKILEAMDIRQTVQIQVSRFPLERLEEVLLQVSGKEFRMITWLGVFLGMVIGGIQAFLFLFLGR
jgi:uncharacterized membrane protein YheB (UPF0754 family)